MIRFHYLLLVLCALLLTLTPVACAQDAASAHVIVLRAARLLDVENGRIVSRVETVADSSLPQVKDGPSS